jgi:hypothetical protein
MLKTRFLVLATLIAVFSLLGLLVSSSFHSSKTINFPDQININVAKEINDTSMHPVGIVMNYLMDDDHNRRAVTSTQEALKEMGVKFLRYPGGEESDSYLWSSPPFTAPAPSLSRVGPLEWPSGSSQFMQPDHRTFKVDPLNFDEYMSIAKNIGAEPVIVVDLDSMYKSATAGGIAPTREQLLQAAVQWVRYANITKRYNVIYWEIGNESYLHNYNGGTDANTYVRDLVEFSRAMKHVDPSIKIGANGSSSRWWQTVLHVASRDIDFLSVHAYPALKWDSYEFYRAHSPSLRSDVDTAIYAINRYASARDRNRIAVAVTEVNSVDTSRVGWNSVNDIGNAIMLFDAIGQQIQRRRVLFSLLWSTRWVNNDMNSIPSVSDALSPQNEYYATGRSLAIWGQYLLDQMVYSTNTTMVRSYASYSPNNKKLNIFLINRDYRSHVTRIYVENYHSAPLAARWVFEGRSVSGPSAGGSASRALRGQDRSSGLRRGRHLSDDPYPVFARRQDGTVIKNRLTLRLDPVSITVVSLAPNVVDNSEFEANQASWKGWRNSTIVADGAHSGFKSLRIGSGSGGPYQSIYLSPNTNYRCEIRAKLASTVDRAWFGVAVKDNTSRYYNYSSRILDNGYTKRTLEFTTPPSVSTAFVWVWKNAGVSYLYVDEVSCQQT